MEKNRWIELSQRFYHWLLRLYPRAYRTAYETEMFHVFTDQCREAYQQRGNRGLLSLWLRTLSDLGVTVVREHSAIRKPAWDYWKPCRMRPYPGRGCCWC